MKLNQIQALEWLVRDFDDNNRLVVEVNGKLVSATFLKKINDRFVTSDDNFDYKTFASNNPKSTVEAMWHALRREFNDGFNNYIRPEVLDVPLFKKLTIIAEEGKMEWTYKFPQKEQLQFPLRINGFDSVTGSVVLVNIGSSTKINNVMLNIPTTAKVFKKRFSLDEFSEWHRKATEDLKS